MRISNVMQAAFIDEMEKLASGMVKEGGVIQNLGTPIKNSMRWAGKHIGEIGENIGSTLHKGFASPIKSTVEGARANVRDSMSSGMGKVMLGLQGYGLYSGVRDLRRSEEETGMGRGERLGRLVGSTAGGFLGYPHGISGGIVGSVAGEKALGAVGKGADKLVGMVRRRPAQMQNQIPPGQVQPE